MRVETLSLFAFLASSLLSPEDIRDELDLDSAWSLLSLIRVDVFFDSLHVHQVCEVAICLVSALLLVPFLELGAHGGRNLP